MIRVILALVIVLVGCSSVGRSCCQMRATQRNDLVEFVRAELEKAGLSLTFLGIPQVESSFNPNAKGKDGSVGLWQLQPATARSFGLRVDNQVDERLSPEKSTKAAVKFLKHLKNRFKSDELVIAGYQLGETKLLNILKRGGKLPAQVERYIQRVYLASLRLSSRLA